MKLIDLFSRTKRRAHYPNEIDPPVRLADDGADRSSMADLVRLLREFDEGLKGNGTRPS